MLGPGEPILVGASGGGDSTALVLLLTDVARLQGRRLVACVVDHALREGSDADAQRAAQIVADLGAEVRVRRVSWPEGPRLAQAHARRARYAALADCARDTGTSVVFLGHTRDDQAETSWMRSEAGSGDRGLAAMDALSPCPVWPEGRELALARPLLGVRRQDLRALLRDAGVPWLEDPANALDRFARTRARAAIAASGETDRLVAASGAARIAAAALDRAAMDLVRACVLFEDGAVRSDLQPDSTDPAPIRALAALACAAGGAEREPSPAGAARILARLERGEGGGLAGACLRPGPPLRIVRDPGGLNGRRGGVSPLPRQAIPAGEDYVWDNRLRLRASGLGWSIAPGPAGAPDIRSGEGAVELRWLVEARVRRLLWRAGDWFQGP